MRIGFEVPPGVVSDDTTFATPGRWADADKVRFRLGRPEVIGGWTSVSGADVSGVCRNVLAWTDNAGTVNIAFGTSDALQIYIGGQIDDITPTGLAAGAVDAAPGPGWGAGPYGEEAYGTPRTLAGPRTWSLSTYGESLIACPLGETIYQWNNDPLTVAQPVANAPARVTYALVTPERQLLAFGCNEEASGTFNPLCIRGTDIEDITDWTTATDNNAFEEILEGGGRIVAARLLGSYVAVWTDNALHIGQFIGAAGQAYRFDRVAENCGAIGPNSIAIVGQTAYWIGLDYQFRTYSIGGDVQILQCPIRNDFQDYIDAAQREKISASTIDAYGEIWWFYPDTRDGNENSRYISLSTLENAWSRGILDRTAAIDAGVVGFPLMVAPDGTAYYHEVGRTANGGTLAWSLESADQYISEGQDNLFVRGAWPDFSEQVSPVNLTVTVRQYPQATPIERGPYSLPSGQLKKDFRATGRVARVKFDGTCGCTRIGKFTFDVVAAGER